MPNVIELQTAPLSAIDPDQRFTCSRYFYHTQEDAETKLMQDQAGAGHNKKKASN